MHQIEIEYEGNLRTSAIHLQSGNRIITDAPSDNEGRGEAFSPTDLVASALGSCILTILGILSERNRINIKGARCKITKVMDKSPRKISKIVVDIIFPEKLSPKNQKLMQQAVMSCPVHRSLNSDMLKDIIFHYPEV